MYIIPEDVAYISVPCGDLVKVVNKSEGLDETDRTIVGIFHFDQMALVTMWVPMLTQSV